MVNSKKQIKELCLMKDVRSADTLLEFTKQIRRDIVQMIEDAGSGHPGGSLSSVEILTVLYKKIMNI